MMETREASVPEAYQAAVKSALNILTYADNTERRLREKLSRRYSPEEVEYAVQYVVTHGFLNEDRQIEEAIRRLACKKLYGRARIAAELFRLGFPREAIDLAAGRGLLDAPDYVAGCKTLIARRGGSREPRDIAYLQRAGYRFSEIKEAYRQYEESSER